MKAKEAAEIIKGIEEVRGSLPEDGLLVEEALNMAIKALELFGNSEQLPSVQLEPLTDKEQRIFLAAMGREEEVCKEVDKGHTREAYEDSLMYICKEIKRKVKGALWT